MRVIELTSNAADDLAAQVRSHKRPGDLAVVSIHWGANWVYEVPDEHVVVAHRLIDRGVDLVHGHSSHHVGAIEVYAGKLILYGCGDLITDYEGIRGHEEWRGDLGAMYFATVADDGHLSGLRIVPTQMRRLRLSRASSADDLVLRHTLERISTPFGARFASDEDGLWLAR